MGARFLNGVQIGNGGVIFYQPRFLSGLPIPIIFLEMA